MLAIAMCLAGCATWRPCSEQTMADADNLLDPTMGDERAELAAWGLWLVHRAGCAAAPPAK